MSTGSDTGKEDREDDLAFLRDLSWEGTELTIMLGENKDTGCEWETEPQDDRIIDYSVNRSFKLLDDGVRYYGVGVMGNGVCVTDEAVQTWWLELYDDGTGFLYNGEDSHGVVSSWEEEGDAFKMTAGIADIEGTDQQGILTLDFDGYYIVYALEDADLSDLTMMTLEEYKAQYGE